MSDHPPRATMLLAHTRDRVISVGFGYQVLHNGALVARLFAKEADAEAYLVQLQAVNPNCNNL